MLVFSSPYLALGHLELSVAFHALLVLRDEFPLLLVCHTPMSQNELVFPSELT